MANLIAVENLQNTNLHKLLRVLLVPICRGDGEAHVLAIVASPTAEQFLIRLLHSTPCQYFNDTHPGGLIRTNAAAVGWDDRHVMILLVLEDSPLGWCLLPAVLALASISFLRVDHVAAEELVHLAVAVQAFGCAGFACFGEDEDFVRHRVKQVFELFLLK